MNVSEAVDFAVQMLSEASKQQVTEAKIDAEYLLAETLQQSFTWLKTWPEHELSTQQQNSFKANVTRRSMGEPIAYIIGHRDFWNLTLKTDNSTLIPRADTELLVETSLELLSPEPQASILDLGTGTGAIALALASERKGDVVFGCDFNPKAVALAVQNKQFNQVNNARFFCSDWFESVSQATNNCEFSLIASNPPYIDKNDPHLKQGDLVFEPDSALVAANNGLADIQVILQQAPNYLKTDGYVILEHGYNQGEAVRNLMQDLGYKKVETRQDIAGLDRVTLGCKP